MQRSLATRDRPSHINESRGNIIKSDISGSLIKDEFILQECKSLRVAISLSQYRKGKYLLKGFASLWL